MIIMTAAGGESIFEIANRLAAESEQLLLTLSIVVAIVFLIWNAVESRMAVARMAVAFLGAGIFLFGVYNILFLRDRTEDTVQNGASLSSVSVMATVTAPSYSPLLDPA